MRCQALPPTLIADLCQPCGLVLRFLVMPVLRFPVRFRWLRARPEGHRRDIDAAGEDDVEGAEAVNGLRDKSFRR